MSCRGWLLVAVVTGVAIAVPVSGTAAGLPRVPRYGVFQRSLVFHTQVANPWEQVQAPVTLTGPGGRRVSIGGFYTGGSTWEFRFAPTTLGVWHWRWRVSDGSHAVASSGSFQVVPGGPGFVRVSPYNHFRWTFDDGAPFYPVGLQDCTVTLLSPNPLAKWGLDGGFTGGDYIHLGRWVDMDTYLSTYSRAGFDLWRWGSNNCSFGLYTTISPTGNVYSVDGGRWADTLFSTLRRYGFRIELVLFGNQPPFPTGNAAQMAAIDRYAKYVVDRYGAYADFWELMNEATVPDAWYTRVGGYLHRIDPYRHPVGDELGPAAAAGVGLQLRPLVPDGERARLRLVDVAASARRARCRLQQADADRRAGQRRAQLGFALRRPHAAPPLDGVLRPGDDRLLEHVRREGLHGRGRQHLPRPRGARLRPRADRFHPGIRREGGSAGAGGR
jgi:hypothetical protein